MYKVQCNKKDIVFVIIQNEVFCIYFVDKIISNAISIFILKIHRYILNHNYQEKISIYDIEHQKSNSFTIQPSKEYFAWLIVCIIRVLKTHILIVYKTRINNEIELEELQNFHAYIIFTSWFSIDAYLINVSPIECFCS